MDKQISKMSVCHHVMYNGCTGLSKFGICVQGIVI